MAAQRRRRRSGRRTVAVAALALAGLLGYGVADVADVVPGPLTAAPLPAAPAPPPPARGAVEPPLAEPVLAPVDDSAPQPDPAVLAAALQGVLDAGALGPGVGALVVDAIDGQVLFEVAAGEPREPASTVKVLTAAAALSVLGPDATLATSVVDGPTTQEVVLVGGGDVLLGAGAGDDAAVNGHAGLADLADETAAALLAQGRREVAVRLDDSLFGGPAVAPGWDAADVGSGFVAPVSALAVDAGRLTPEPYAQREGDPALAAAQRFADLLAERGVAPLAPPVRALAPPAAEPLAVVRSAPVGDVVALMLVTSDNTVAESLAKLVAAQSGRATTFADAAAAVRDAVALLGVDVEGAVLVDGSGLGDGARVSPRTLVGTLAAAASADAPDLRPLLTGLPVARWSGTLLERFADPAAAGAGGVVRAKTGSLLGVTSLAGAVQDADGRLLLFAVMADEVPAGRTGAARAAADRFAAVLAGCGCR